MVIREMYTLLSELPLSWNSMLYWWPRLEGVDVPKPKTVLLRFDNMLRLVDILVYEDCFTSHRDAVADTCKRVSDALHDLRNRALEYIDHEKMVFPLFMRTDQQSLKHDPTKPYRLDGPGDILPKMSHFILYNDVIMGVPAPRAFAIREWIEPETWIDEYCCDAFKNMPYNRVEVRVIAEDGEVKEMFPYYHINGFMKRYYGRVSRRVIRRILEAYRDNYLPRIEENKHVIEEYARKISVHLPGGWSIDFMLGVDGKWYFIDTAREEDSWRPPPLEQLPLDARLLLKRYGVASYQ